MPCKNNFKTVNSLGRLIILIFIAGCWAPKSIVTTQNITQPVLVGNVITIGGKSINNNSLTKQRYFSEKVENSLYAYSIAYYYGYNRIRGGSNIFDNKLTTLGIEGLDPYSRDIIIIDQIRFNASSGYWLFVFSTSNKGYLEGGIYRKLKSNK